MQKVQIHYEKYNRVMCSVPVPCSQKTGNETEGVEIKGNGGKMLLISETGRWNSKLSDLAKERQSIGGRAENKI